MVLQITEKEYEELKRAGYSPEQISQAVRNVEVQELQDSYDDAQQMYEDDPRAMSQQSSFVSQVDENLIKWQLELNDILERAEHILRGDVPKYVKGVLIWDANPEPEENPFNTKGIHEIMKILAMYINRNTILSDYNNDEIRYKVFDFGRRLNNYIFMKYDEIGMNTEEKRKSYEMIVGELVDLVHSAYKRALLGGERRSLREMIQVSQNYQAQGYPEGQMMVAQGQRERSVLNPMRALKGKYV